MSNTIDRNDLERLRVQISRHLFNSFVGLEPTSDPLTQGIVDDLDSKSCMLVLEFLRKELKIQLSLFVCSTTSSDKNRYTLFYNEINAYLPYYSSKSVLLVYRIDQLRGTS